MLKRFSDNVATLFMFLDALAVMAALRIAQVVRPGLSSWAGWIKDIPETPYIGFHFFLIFAVVWVVVFMSFSIYDPHKHLKPVEELVVFFKGCLVIVVVLPGILYFANREMSRVLFVSFAILASIFTLSYRLIYRAGFQVGLIKTRENRRILIVGAGVIGRRLAQTIQNFNRYGFEIVGFVDDKRDLIDSQVDVLGDLDQTRAIIINQKIQHLIITLPRRAHARTTDLVSRVHDLPVRVWVIPDYFALALNKASVIEFADFPLIDLRPPVLNSYQRLLKRVFDLMVAIPAFILTLPLFGLLALLIRLDSQGPVLYRSKRLKEIGAIFEMLKFRTMVTGADAALRNAIKDSENEVVVHKRPDDPRVTRIGRFLRCSSLDELPQLINIIRGEMSLVGPRPELPEMVSLYEPWQRARFAVPQGLTGWWQVSGRSDKPMHLHTEDDLYYIQHYSLWFDLQILLRTVIVVIKGKGAY